MFFANVRLPDEIYSALETDQLVIFAGAGVSIAPPSNLPSFNQLASEIANGEKVIGAEDHFLGKLADERNTNVHAAAAQILYGTHTEPTDLHYQIVRLFGSAGRTRLVTTNFDSHFSTTAKELYPNDAFREFVAPALPLGDNFNGLIYLHGSAKVESKQLVLTDKDFGSAYITRGWAKTFLLSLFSKYTVLFVGYSHSDIIMSYLARGLPAQNTLRRWAMLPSDATSKEKENWKHHGIATIPYGIDLNNTENKHYALTTFFEKWSDHNEESVFQRSKRIKDIARGLPPEGEETSAYLQQCLSDARLANDFCTAIKHEAWIGWMHDRGYFNSFFEDSNRNSFELSSKEILTHWVSTTVRKRNPEILIDLFRRHGNRLTPSFAGAFARNLWADKEKNSDRRFALWLSILLAQGLHITDPRIWFYLLSVCNVRNHRGVAILLFTQLTSPRIKIEEGLRWVNEDSEQRNERPSVEYSIEWYAGNGRWLRDAWEKAFQPHLALIADQITEIVTSQIIQAYRILGDVSKKRGFDPIGYSRSSIAPHQQNDITRDEFLSAMLDILCTTHDFQIKKAPKNAMTQARAWWKSRIPLLRRFAAYSRSIDSQYTSEEQIKWILQKKLLFKMGMKKEVFDILAIAYPNATLRSRKKLIERVICSRDGLEGLEGEVTEYERYNLLVWLRRNDESCDLVKEAILDIQRAHPIFEERDHPNFESWHGEATWGLFSDEVNVEKLLKKTPEELVAHLKLLRNSHSHLELRDYLMALPEIFKNNAEVRERFVLNLAASEIDDEEIWKGVFWGWRDNLKTTGDWQSFCAIIESISSSPAIFSGVTNVLSHGYRNFKEEWDTDLKQRVVALMNMAWDLCKDSDESTVSSHSDWLTTAINDVGGWIGEFWVQHCSDMRKSFGKSWTGIPEALKKRISEAVHGRSRICVLARISITPWVGYFYEWDKVFTAETLLPMFDWSLDSAVAQQSWSTLLRYKRASSKGLEKELIPFYKQCAEKMTHLLKDTTERSEQFDSASLTNIGAHLGALAVHVIADPVDSGFFRDFLPLLTDDAKGTLARSIANNINDLSAAKRLQVWEIWVQKYLKLRLVGVPIAVSTREASAMLEWCFVFEKTFPDCVALVSKFPQESVFAYGIIKNISASPLLSEFPKSACQLINTALKADDSPYLSKELEQLHSILKTHIRKEQEFVEFEELLYMRGWEK